MKYNSRQWKMRAKNSLVGELLVVVDQSLKSYLQIHAFTAKK